MTVPALALRALTAADETEALAAHAELAADRTEFLLALRDRTFPEYLAALDRQRTGADVPAGWVPATFLVAVVGDDLVGRASIRHELNEHLARIGGHIGYVVRPAFRRRGYATQILRQALRVAAALGIDPALLTCDETNVGSVTVIERCGGVLENVVAVPDSTVGRCRYWVPTRA